MHGPVAMQEQNPRQSSGQPFSECSSSCLCICLPGCLSVAGILYKYFTCVLQKLQGVTLILLFHMCMPTGADTDFFLPAASSRSEIAERHIPEDRTPELKLGCKTQTASGMLRRENSFPVTMQERSPLITAQKTKNQKIRHLCLPHGSAGTQALHSPLRNQRN